MIPEPLLSLGHNALRIFRVFGKLEFVRRLHDFLLHEGRRSRAQTLEQTVKVVLDLEKAQAQAIKNSRALMDLMKDAGFPEDSIQATLRAPEEMQRVSAALKTMLHYVDNGVVTINVVSEPDRKSDDLDTKLSIPREKLKLPTSKSKPRNWRGTKKKY
jgi:hypothetical protein